MAGVAEMEGTPSSWRPPWLLTISASARSGHGQLRILDVHDAFQDQLAAPALLILDIAPVQRGSRLLAGPSETGAHVLDALDVADDVCRKHGALRAQHPRHQRAALVPC